MQSSGGPRPFLALYLAAFIVAGAGWGGLYYLVNYMIPTIGPRWLFFVCWMLALTGTAVPFVHYLNQRFGRQLPAPSVLLRQATWVGVYGAILAWLQLGRALNWANALLILFGLLAIEWFLRLRERTRWNPFASPLDGDSDALDTGAPDTGTLETDDA